LGDKNLIQRRDSVIDYTGPGFGGRLLYRTELTPAHSGPLLAVALPAKRAGYCRRLLLLLSVTEREPMVGGFEIVHAGTNGDFALVNHGDVIGYPFHFVEQMR
jgi:hypothetical protein